MITYLQTYKTLTTISTNWQTLSNTDKHDHILKKYYILTNIIKHWQTWPHTDNLLHVSVYYNQTKRGTYKVDIFIILSNVISSHQLTAEKHAHLALNSNHSFTHATQRNRYIGNYDNGIAFRRFDRR
jgi:hypothetical protein